MLNKFTLKALNLFFLFALTMLFSCNSSQQQAEDRGAEIDKMCKPYLGTSRSDVVLGVGLPTHKETIEKIEVFQYFRSYGQRDNVWVSPSDYLIIASKNTWEAYDKINFYFENDVCVKYDYVVQR